MTMGFSLLLLEPGEIYFEDFSALCDPIDGKSSNNDKKGMLKVCSKSVIFDPKDEEQPILKFLYRDISEIKEWESPNNFYKKEAALVLETNQVIEMKPDNLIAPYIFKRERMKYIFRLEWKSTEDCVPHMCQLLRASTLPIADQTAMISAIVTHRQQLVPFDKSWLESLFEDIIYEAQCDQIRPLVVNPGRLMLTTERLYFQPFNNADPKPVMIIKLGQISRIVKRRFLLRHVGLEIFYSDHHLYLAFKSPSDRENLYSALRDHVQLEDLGQQNMSLRWQNGVISNFEYLIYLNSLADRSVNDLTQYPVFPWVIKDFSSDKLDLANESVFRDLHKPIGALNQERLDRLLTRYNEMPSPRFLYGSHYSTPGYVLYYLVRAAPEYMLCLQNGRFDQPDRMFNSVADAWTNCLTSYSDFKELVPEFFEGDGDFLLNSQAIDFGNRQDGTPVGDVKLPPWAQDRQDFIRQQREALESDYVTKHLHHWIDLIFGYKQQGSEAEKAHNLFFYLTYEGAIDLDSIVDLDERAALEQQIMEFGQTPKQLFTNPHPARLSPIRLAVKETKIFSEISNQTVESLHMKDSVDLPSSSAGSCVKDMECLVDCSVGTQNVELESTVAETVDSALPLGELDSALNTSKPTHSSLPNVEKITLSTDLVLQCNNRTEALSISSQLNSCQSSHSAEAFCDTFKTVSKDVSDLKICGCHGCGMAIHNEPTHLLERLSVCKHHDLHRSPVSCVKWRENGDVLYSADQDGCVKMYSWAEDQQVHSVNLSSMCLSSMVELCDLQSLLVASWDNYLYLYSFEFGRLLSSTPAHDDAVSCLSLSEDQHHLVTGSWDSTVKVWDCSQGSGKNGTHFVLKGEFDHDSTVTCVNQSADCQQVITSTGDGVITVWDTLTQTPVIATRPHTEAINGQQLNLDCTRVVTVGSDQLLTITDVHNGAQIFSTSVDDTPRCVCWQGDLVAIGTDSGDIQVWDVTQGKLMYKVTLQGPVNCMTVNKATGMAAGGSTGTVTLLHTLL